jgi:hypothetical protein
VQQAAPPAARPAAFAFFGLLQEVHLAEPGLGQGVGDGKYNDLRLTSQLSKSW